MYICLHFENKNIYKFCHKEYIKVSFNIKEKKYIQLTIFEKNKMISTENYKNLIDRHGALRRYL